MSLPHCPQSTEPCTSGQEDSTPRPRPRDSLPGPGPGARLVGSSGDRAEPSLEKGGPPGRVTIPQADMYPGQTQWRAAHGWAAP